MTDRKAVDGPEHAASGLPVDVQIEIVTAADWPDVARLLSSGRTSAACWCMWFRRSPRDYEALPVGDREAALRDRTAEEPPPALLARAGREPVGWLSLGPIAEFEPRLDRWSVAPSALPEGAWVIVCLFVPAGDRRRGIATALITEAVGLARRAGASAVVAFPLHVARSGRAEGATGVGYAAQFVRAGFSLEPGPLESRPTAILRLSRPAWRP